MELDPATNWGRWGDDDERGALNLLTQDAVLRGAGVIRRGKVYGLGLPIGQGRAPAFAFRGEPRRFTLTCDSDENRYRAIGGEDGVGGNQDVLMLASHHGTHIDALSHTFVGNRMYNGFHSSTFKAFSGAEHLGIERLGVFAGRAVLLDVAAHAGVPWLAPGHVITSADLDACAQTFGVEVQPGDILLVRTGWLEWWRAHEPVDMHGTSQPGIGIDAVSFVRDHDVAAIGADNSAVEVLPFDGGTALPVHIELLVHLGVPLLEHLDLSELAADGVRECFLCVAPLPVKGAAGSPVNPIAIA